MSASTIKRYGYFASKYLYIDNVGNPWSRYQYDFIAGQFPDMVQADGYPEMPPYLRMRMVTFLSTPGGYRYNTWVNSPEAVFDMSKYQFGFGGRIFNPWFYTGEIILGGATAYTVLTEYWRLAAKGL